MNSAPDVCPFCATADHLSYQWPGSMTADMPDRPCRVICTHIDHDTVVGPTAYGKPAATVAWNTRPATNAGNALREVLERLADATPMTEPFIVPIPYAGVGAEYAARLNFARDRLAALSASPEGEG